MMCKGANSNPLGQSNMSGFRAVLVGLGLTLGCALVGWCAGVAIGLGVAESHFESAPKDAEHGVAYVAAGKFILVRRAGLAVGFVSGLYLAAWYLRKRSKPDTRT
jgi:hypothetical protein